MDNVFVGKIVNTHGIKGELRIKSDFELKSKVFKKGNVLIAKGIEYKINTYRVHKDFDMVTFEGINNINDVLFLKGSNVFVKREVLELDNDDYILSDLIDFEVALNDQVLGVVTDYTTGGNPLLCIDYDGKNYYIPLKGDFISQVDKENRIIKVEDSVKGLII